MPQRRRLGLSILFNRRRSAHVVVAGALDVGTAPSLGRMLADLNDDHVDVTLDLGAVTFLDPAGLAAVHKAGEEFRGNLAVVPPTSGPARRFIDVLDVEPLLCAA